MGPAVGQISTVAAAVEDLERWIQDERLARRQHFSDMLESLREIRDDVAKHKEETADALAALRQDVGRLGADERAGRRAVIIAVIGAVSVIVASLAGAAALVITSSPT